MRIGLLRNVARMLYLVSQKYSYYFKNADQNVLKESN